MVSSFFLPNSNQVAVELPGPHESLSLSRLLDVLTMVGAIKPSKAILFAPFVFLPIVSPFPSTSLKRNCSATAGFQSLSQLTRLIRGITGY